MPALFLQSDRSLSVSKLLRLLKRQLLILSLQILRIVKLKSLRLSLRQTFRDLQKPSKLPSKNFLLVKSAFLLFTQVRVLSTNQTLLWQQQTQMQLSLVSMYVLLQRQKLLPSRNRLKSENIISSISVLKKFSRLWKVCFSRIQKKKLSVWLKYATPSRYQRLA